MEQMEAFSWLKDLNKPILGICAGMQVISAFFGGSIVPHPAIGLEKIEIIRDRHHCWASRDEIEGYHLHNYAVTLPEGFHAAGGRTRSSRKLSSTARFPSYGIIFHPEVRNRWILERFANLSRSPGLAGNSFPSKPIYVMNPHYCALCKTIPSINFWPWPRPHLSISRSAM